MAATSQSGSLSWRGCVLHVRVSSCAAEIVFNTDDAGVSEEERDLLVQS